MSFSSDGKTLATGSVGMDKTIKLWNVETGQEIRTLSGHNNSVNSVSFSPDGKTLATGSHDGTIKLWNGEYGWGLDGLMGRSCAWVRAYLHNPNSDAREEDRYLCDGIGGRLMKIGEVKPKIFMQFSCLRPPTKRQPDVLTA